jgi:hypothetical protein
MRANIDDVRNRSVGQTLNDRLLADFDRRVLAAMGEAAVQLPDRLRLCPVLPGRLNVLEQIRGRGERRSVDASALERTAGLLQPRHRTDIVGRSRCKQKMGECGRNVTVPLDTVSTIELRRAIVCNCRDKSEPFGYEGTARVCAGMSPPAQTRDRRR